MTDMYQRMRFEVSSNARAESRREDDKQGVSDVIVKDILLWIGKDTVMLEHETSQNQSHSDIQM